jgi:hypothetical protein
MTNTELRYRKVIVRSKAFMPGLPQPLDEEQLRKGIYTTFQSVDARTADVHSAWAIKPAWMII